MPRILEKVERRLGEKLFIKGDRCLGPKCALIRRNYPPGAHGRKKRKGGSEYAGLLREKQKIRFLYGLDDKDVKRYTELAAAKSGIFSSNFWQMLERRLDNVVFRLGLAESRRAARHLVSYGHITVNGKGVTIPSCQVKPGDSVALHPRWRGSLRFSELEMRLKNYEPPAWLSFDKEKKAGKIVALPDIEDAATTVDMSKVKEFYSR